MTEYSQNGYVAGDRSLIVTLTVPGTTVQLPVRKGAPGQLLVAAAARWHREVEPLITPGCWGYAYREIRGSTTDLSNHASGTAVDLNAPHHPLGTDPVDNYTAAQIAAIRRIVDTAQGALRWGGDYGVPARGGAAGSRPDGMHVEVVGNEAACTAALPLFTTVPNDRGVLMALTDAEQTELLSLVRALKPGVRLPGRSPALANTVDDHFGWSMTAAGRADSAAHDITQLRAEVAALRDIVARLGDPNTFAAAVAANLAARLKD